MNLKTTILALLGIMLLTECKTAKITDLQQEEPSFTSFPATLKEVRSIEKKLHGKDDSYSYTVGIGESLYPNEQHFSLTKVKRYLRPITKEGVRYTIEYFATADDSVRVILYEWNSFRIDPENMHETIDGLNNKFNRLDSTFTALLGKPTVKDIKNNFQNETARDDIKWTGNQLNAYLLMFKRQNSFSGQIRLIIYPQ